ncbi:MAG: guanylate kinase [Thermacetogeniaceae bacterium]
MIVISGPSGSGKGTLCALLRQALPNLEYSISLTTRQPRPGEQNGVDYFFVSDDEFKTMIGRGEFLEWAEVYGHHYGTARSVVESCLRSGRDVLLEIDIQGAQNVKRLFPQSILIFIEPPSLQELGARIAHRGTETEEAIRRRMNCVPSELQAAEGYDYVVVNDTPEQALAELLKIIEDARRSIHCR